MKPMFRTVCWLLAGVASLRATEPLCENNVPVATPPVVDCTAFVNRSEFNVLTTLLYDFSNCLFFTNTGSGSMSGNPGFRFDFVTNFNRYAAGSFHNDGSVSAETNLLIYATNIYSPGDLRLGPGGVMRLIASNRVDVGRSGLRSGATPSQFLFGGGFFTGGTFVNDPGVSDLYWGAGQNNRLNNSGQPMRLDIGDPNLDVPLTFSPAHAVIQAGTLLTNDFTRVQGFSALTNLFDAFVYTNSTDPTNLTIQMVFVNTNLADPNMKTRVSFLPQSFFDEPAIAVVEFASEDNDLVLNQTTTNFVYVLDRSATVTNITLQRNLFAPTRRPSSLAVTRSTLPLSSGLTNFIPFTPALVYNPNYRSNRVTVRYSAYSAQIGEASVSAGFGVGLPPAPTPARLEPTNMPGRVEITGAEVNLEQTRVRAESLFSLKTRNLTSNFLARVDAPFLIYDLGTVQPVLEITNLAAPSVRRLSGVLNMWSGTWTNVATNSTATSTNVITIAFHALIVENQLTTIRPVMLEEFGAHATNVVIGDQLNIAKTMLIEATNLHIVGGLTLPPLASWAETNVPGLVNLTNDGRIVLLGAGRFGAAPAAPYSNLVNRGFISGFSHDIRALYFESSGSPLVSGSGSISASAGLLSVSAGTGVLEDGELAGNGDVQVYAGVLTNRNSILRAGISNSPGALVLGVTNRISEGDTATSNFWSATSGFQFVRRPAEGDLMGTRLVSRIASRTSVSHLWAGEDRGTNNAGFTNNLALGTLVLSAETTNSVLFTFLPASPGGPNALYVDYLDLVGQTTNYDTALRIEPGMRIYFANASVPPSKLDGRHGGRLVWVSSFAGPNSSTNITYPNGSNYVFNVALVTDRDLDSDGDGCVNAEDPCPIDVGPPNPSFVTCSDPAPDCVIMWNAVSRATNILECTSDLVAGPWLEYTNFFNFSYCPEPTTVTVMRTNATQFYRIRAVYPNPP